MEQYASGCAYQLAQVDQHLIPHLSDALLEFCSSHVERVMSNSSRNAEDERAFLASGALAKIALFVGALATGTFTGSTREVRALATAWARFC